MMITKLVENLKKDWLEVIGIIVLFLSAFFYWKYTSIVTIGMGSVCFFCLIKKKKMRISMEYIFLCLSIVSLGVIGFEWDKSLFVNIMTPIFFYTFGILFVDKTRIHSAYIILMTLAYSLFFENIISAIALYKNGFPFNGNYRGWYSLVFKIRMLAPGYVFFGLIISSFLFYSIYRIKDRRLKDYIIIISTIFLVIFNTIKAQGRTFILIVVLVFLINLCVYFILNHNNIKKIVRICILMISLIALVTIVFNGRIIDYYNNSFLSRDGGIINNSRFVTQKKAIAQILDFPMGNNRMDIGEMKSTHNMWLDFAYIGGIFPFIMLILFTVFSIIDVVKLIASKNIEKEYIFLFVSAYSAIGLYLFVESVVYGCVMYRSIWFLICSIINNLVHSDRGEESERVN